MTIKIYYYLLAGLQLIKERKLKDLSKKINKVFKLQIYGLIYNIRKKHIKESKIEVFTQHPIAYESPDHIEPAGTKNDNSTNKIFVIKIDKILKKEQPRKNLSVLDLGCAGGAMISDFKNIGYIAVGLEGSDYSFKNKRAHWKELSNINLFTCDITKDYKININNKHHLFTLITAWEVMEHISENDLYNTFKMIDRHLDFGGYFIFSTTNTSDIRNGIELHQTQMKTQEWITWTQKKFPNLQVCNLGLDNEEFVRQGTNKTICLKKL